MTFCNEPTAARELRELAKRVVRDDIDSDHLDAYMHELLSALVELSASCRLEATVVSHCFAGLPAREVALRLNERASRLEQNNATSAHDAGRSLNPAAAGRTAAAVVRHAPARSHHSVRQASWIPEFIGALVFTALGAIMLSWPKVLFPRPLAGAADAHLRFSVGAACVLAGSLYAYEAVRQAWRHAHRRITW